MDVEMNDAPCLSEDSEFYGDTLPKEQTINCSAYVSNKTQMTRR